MSDRRPCTHCGRTIDAYARICPYCNWDQNQPVPAVTPKAVEAAQYVPPPDVRWRKPVFGAIGGLLLIIAAFTIGMQVHGRKPPTVVPGHETTPEAAAASTKPQQRANVTLVPDNSPTPNFEVPITSAPVTETAAGTPNEFQRADATAVSSDEYAQLAKRAQAEKKKMSAMVDPRTIGGVAYNTVGGPPRRAPQQTAAATPAPPQPPPMFSAQQAPPPPLAPPEKREEERHAVARTNPKPVYQPLPQIRVSDRAVARVELTVGDDGRVHEVNVRQGLGANTGRLIAAVQSWRFKPATLNGVPVSSSFTVELQFNP